MTDSNESMTLDPPGTIAVVGAGALGIEAALYGRFLGYDVTLVEAESVGSHLREQSGDPLPMLPNRCLSPLAVSALDAQSSEDAGQGILPITFGQWLEEALIPLTESDLLAGRLTMPARVVKIQTVAVTLDEEETEQDLHGGDGDNESASDPIPADFRLHLSDGRTLDAEAVILAIGASPPIDLDFPIPIPYFFQIGQDRGYDAEKTLHLGLREIVELYAGLAGRTDLDLYRPRRH